MLSHRYLEGLPASRHGHDPKTLYTGFFGSLMDFFSLGPLSQELLHPRHPDNIVESPQKKLKTLNKGYGRCLWVGIPIVFICIGIRIFYIHGLAVESPESSPYKDYYKTLIYVNILMATWMLLMKIS